MRSAEARNLLFWLDKARQLSPFVRAEPDPAPTCFRRSGRCTLGHRGLRHACANATGHIGRLGGPGGMMDADGGVNPT